MPVDAAVSPPSATTEKVTGPSVALLAAIEALATMIVSSVPPVNVLPPCMVQVKILPVASVFILPSDLSVAPFTVPAMSVRLVLKMAADAVIVRILVAAISFCGTITNVRSPGVASDLMYFVAAPKVELTKRDFRSASWT